MDGPGDAPQWAGPLGSLLALPGVTDVLVQEPRRAWIDRGGGLQMVGVDLPDSAAVRALAVRMAGAGGRRLDDAAPVVDARLPDGTRLHAVLPPLSPECAAISLRTVRQRALDMDDLVASGMVTGQLGRVLRAMVARHLSVLVTGATGSGKTTLLASMLSLVDPAERILVIEEAGELRPDHPHVVRLIERRANIEGSGAVGLPTLVREAMRMRPDRVVLGECRGAEVREVLSVFNTGHRGGFATLHANSTADVPARLVALGALAGLDQRTVELQAAIAFDAVVHVERDGASVRRVAQVATLSRSGAGDLVAVPALTRGSRGWEAGPAWAALGEGLGLSQAGHAVAA
ncbi:TadA family conjugal transfer-associated ATPase [Demequina sp. NBRC 110051]|uniref:TadA family conjugal transfer-associated ATPase n=1 Tax=Demequina sp. NBRC 110051 TaxID=1570340 RepID=UPI001F4571A8|nr:TadA family conjugal transfer-associated ATPase [Demequina sp. NBRC 110051]